MMLKKLPWLFFLVLFGCIRVEPIEFQKIKNIKLISSEKDNLLLRGDLTIFNPNSISGIVEKFNLTTTIDDQKVAETREIDQTLIAANNVTPIPFESKLDLKNLGKVMEKQAFGFLLGGEVELDFQGEITSNIKGFSKTSQINFKKKISLQNLSL
ncbi:MAG TPA: LEA type 2 family protein [Cyclobacteriaceae bacterium]